LAAGLRPSPLGKLTALPQTPWLDSQGRGGMGERVIKGEREEGKGGMGKEGIGPPLFGSFRRLWR